MADVQPGSQERCHRFHAVPKSGCLETLARRSAALQHASAFPQIIKPVRCRGFGILLDGSVGAEGATPHPHRNARRLRAIRPCAWKHGSFAESAFLLFAVSVIFLGGVLNRISVFCRKENDLLAWRSEGSVHVPADMHIIAAWRGLACCWPRLGKRLTLQELLRGPLGDKLLIIPAVPL